jgi:flavin reductase (DIM6/NTAB) family NADH-FMN oxidoreductase RutF
MSVAAQDKSRSRLHADSYSASWNCATGSWQKPKGSLKWRDGFLTDVNGGRITVSRPLASLRLDVYLLLTKQLRYQRRTKRYLLLKNVETAPAEYRDCMARFAGAVHVVTTDGAHGRRGVTVSAVTSVSDNPPTLLFCLNRNREENRQFAANGCFALNTLGYDQIGLARAFAGEGHLAMDQRFAMGSWYELQSGAPVLILSRMSLDCRVTKVIEVATHFVIFGEVIASVKSNDENTAALIYSNRQYHAL